MVDTKELGIVVTGNIDDITTALNGVLDLLDGLTDKVINVSTNIQTDGIDTLEGELGGIEGSLTNVSNVADDTANHISQIGDAGSSAGAELESGLSPVVDTIDEVGTRSDEAGKKVEDIGKKSEETGEKADAGFGTAELAVLAFLGTLELTAQSLDTLNTKFDKMSNMEGSIPEGNLRDMVADISNVSFSAEEVLAYITALKQAGLETEDSLKRGADAMDTIQEGTGVTQEETIKFLNSLIVMGVDLNNIGSAYNAIAYAQGNVVGGFSTYIQWMMKYDSTFKEMGLNIDQTAVLIAGATKKFGGGRAAYTGLNKAIKESNGDLSVLESKLGLTAGSLDNATQSTAEYSGKLEKNRGEVREHTTALQKSGAVVEDVGIKFGDVISAVASAGAIIGGLLGLFAIGIPGAAKILDGLWGTDGYFLTKYTEFASKYVEKMRTFGGKVIDIIKGWWPSWGKASEKGAGEVSSKLLQSGDDIGRAGAKAGETVVEYISPTGEKIALETEKIGYEVLGKTPETSSRIGSFFDVITGAFRTGWTKIISLTPDWVLGVGRAITTAVGRLGLGEVLASLGKFALPKLALTGDVAFVAGLEQVRAGLVDMSLGFKTGNTAIDEFQYDFLTMVEGIQYSTPAFGNAIMSLDLLNGVIDNLLKGKGWDSFGIAFSDLRARLDRDAQGLSDNFKRVFGVELPEYLNPVSLFEKVYTFDFQAIWDDSIFGGTYDFPDISGGASTFLSTLASYMSVDNLLGSVVSGWDGLLDYLQGIPDRILGAIGGVNWYSIGEGLGDAIAWVLENLYYLLKGITELPGRLYTGVIGLGQSIYNGLVAIPGMIQGGVNTALIPLGNLYTWLTLLPGRAYNSIIGLGQYIYAGLVSIPGRVQEGLLSIWNQFLLFLTWIQTLPERLVTDVSNGFNGMVDYIASIPDKVWTALMQIWQRFLDFIAYLGSLPGQFYNAIVNAINGFVSGLSSKFPEISMWLGKIADLFPHSPPKAGPLIDIMDWGGNMAEAIGGGIESNFPKVASAFNSQLQALKDGVTFSDINVGSLAIPEGNLGVIDANLQARIPTGGTTTPGVGGGETTIHVHVNLAGATIGSLEEADEVGDRVGKSTAKSLANELVGQANRGGVPVINLRRD